MLRDDMQASISIDLWLADVILDAFPLFDWRTIGDGIGKRADLSDSGQYHPAAGNVVHFVELHTEPRPSELPLNRIEPLQPAHDESAVGKVVSKVTGDIFQQALHFRENLFVRGAPFISHPQGPEALLFCRTRIGENTARALHLPLGNRHKGQLREKSGFLHSSDE